MDHDTDLRTLSCTPATACYRAQPLSALRSNGCEVSNSNPQERSVGILYGCQVAFYRVDLQILGCYCVRRVLQYRKSLQHRIFTPKFQKHRFMYQVQTNLHPRTEIPLEIALRRSRNGSLDELEANTEVRRALPFAPKSQTCHGISGCTRER